MRLADGSHLTYCSNIHPAETWPQLRNVLIRFVPEVKRRVAPDRPFGIGLRISKRCLDGLDEEGGRADLRELLAAHGLYVFTFNGFPYGDFHGQPVKRAVYRPDWRTVERLRYTERLADLLVELLPDEPGLEGSISTLPCGERRAIEGEEERVAEMLLRQVAHLAALREKSGRTITLGLEPEPGCRLETAGELVAYFKERLLSRQALAFLGTLSGLSAGRAEEAVRRHAGMCLDLCHAAVQVEDPAAVVDIPRRAGIRIVKLQVTAGLSGRGSVEALGKALAPLADDVYLHQVTELGPAGRRQFLDVPAAQSAADSPAGEREWRIHYHVPVFWEDYGALRSTREFTAAVLARHRRDAVSNHLEVETYTWEVLPEVHRGDVVDVVTQELTWVMERLGDDPGNRL